MTTNINAVELVAKLAGLPRFNAGSYGGMAEREDGTYLSVSDLVEVLASLTGKSQQTLLDDLSGELGAQRRGVIHDEDYEDQRLAA